MRVLVLVVTLLVVASGCISAQDAGDAADAAGLGAFVVPIVADHDHAAFEEHDFAPHNMHLIGHTTMSEDGAPYSYIGEMDTYGDLTVVQVLGRGSMPGFVVIDTSDPSDPTPIGRGDMPFSYVVDVKFSPDGERVFAASQAGAQRSRSHEGPESEPFGFVLQGNGFTEWDMSDPTQPVAVAGGLAEPSGCHMLSVQDIGGTRYVFCIADTVLVFEYTQGGAWVQTGVLAPDAGAVPYAVSEALGYGASAPNMLLLGATPHDITIQEDPKEAGRLIASVSYWDLGVMFYDVTDPRQPQLIGAWAGQGAEVYEGNVHGAQLVLHEGKRLAVVGPELLGDTVPAIWVLDVDDLAAPKLVTEWVPPGQHVTQGLLLTVHQFQVVQDRIYLAYNHAGLWVLDLPTILAGGYEDDPARPDVLGYYLPNERVELFDPDVAAVPNTWDVNVKDGYVFASDRYTGFYVLHLQDDPMGDAAFTSRT